MEWAGRWISPGLWFDHTTKNKEKAMEWGRSQGCDYTGRLWNSRVATGSSHERWKGVKGSRIGGLHVLKESGDCLHFWHFRRCFPIVEHVTHTHTSHTHTHTSIAMAIWLGFNNEKIPHELPGILRIYSASNNTCGKRTGCQTFGVSTEDVQMKRQLLPRSSLYSRRNIGM